MIYNELLIIIEVAALFHIEGYVHQVDDAVAGVETEAIKFDLSPCGGSKTWKNPHICKKQLPYFLSCDQIGDEFLFKKVI